MRSFALFAVMAFATTIGFCQYAPAVPTEDGVLGYWSTDAGSVLHVDHCREDVCITVLTISKKAPGVIDAHNPDPTLRARPICKLDIGTGFRLKDANHGENGRVYDPATGKTYKSVISSEGNTLTLRGYIGFRAIGRSETWKRTSADYATCVGTTHR